jgi:hypothetical protein
MHQKKDENVNMEDAPETGNARGPVAQLLHSKG